MWATIGRQGPQLGAQDEWEWTSNFGKVFIVKQVYDELLNSVILEDASFYKMMWKLSIPSKCKGLVYQLEHNPLQTKENMQK